MNDLDGQNPNGNEPIIGSAVWYGRDMVHQTDWIYSLSDIEVEEIESAIAHVRSQNLDIIEVRKDDFPLPTLYRMLARARQDLVDGRGFYLIRGMPVNRWSAEDIGLAFSGIGRYVGEAIMQNRIRSCPWTCH